VQGTEADMKTKRVGFYRKLVSRGLPRVEIPARRWIGSLDR